MQGRALPGGPAGGGPAWSLPAASTRSRGSGHDGRHGRPSAPGEEHTIREQLDFRVEGLDCTEEAALLRDALGDREGVHGVSFHVVDGRMTVDADTDTFGPDRIAEAVSRLGMRAEPWDAAPRVESWWEAHGRHALVATSGLALTGGLLLHIVVAGGGVLETLLAHAHGAHGIDRSVVLLLLAGIVAGLFHSAPKAVASLVRLRPDMNALVLVSVIGALFLAEWAEAAVLAFLYGLSGLLENWSARRARNAIGSLLRITPATAAVVHGDHEHRTPVDRVAVGTHVRVRPGERIPCDGVVTDGSSYVDQALVTGESVPAWKTAGDEVFAGTVNGHGVVELLTTRAASDTMLARITRMVGESHHHRAPTERFIDHFARYYTPLMFAVAFAVGAFPPLLLGGDWEHWFYQAMLILLISCPCGLVISTPVTIAAAITSATRHGVLIKGGSHLEELGRLCAIAFDKTGIITRGEPDVRELRPVGGRTEDEVLARLLSIELRSEHPLSRAIVRHARERGVEPAELTDFAAIEGRGAEAVIDGKRFWVGSTRFARERTTLDGYETELSGMQRADETIVVCGAGDDVWALVAVADPVRTEAPASVAQIHGQGLRSALLTGDNAATARSVGDRVQLQDVRAELLPDGKADAIRELMARHGPTAMIGDGINDGQALLAASVGIAMGGNATDVAAESADVVLMQDDLRKLPFLVSHARRARRVIIENVTVALGAKAVFLAFMAAGAATLWMAVAADMGASLLVTFNGLRMLRSGAVGGEAAPEPALAGAGQET
ncbi:MAG: heavy metal translocating P-type ATPase [Acidobacteria bacterium]|nr:heavy metal translocating P-type ATPase [Acidobacteriota bacterium]